MEGFMVRMVLSGQTIMVTEKVAKTIQNRTAQKERFWEKFFNGDNTLYRLGNPGNQLAGWLAGSAGAGEADQVSRPLLRGVVVEQTPGSSTEKPEDTNDTPEPGPLDWPGFPF
jgi:hypothetical protein